MMPSMQDELTKQIASDLGISELTPDKQNELIAQFGEIALKAATIAVIEKLPTEKRDDFMKLSEAGDAAALQEFLNREVPDHEALAKAAVAEEIKRFKDFQSV